MKEQSDTPETDAAEREDAGPITHARRGWNYSRKHERERDAAIREIGEQARLLGISGSREMALLAKVDSITRERDEARAIANDRDAMVDHRDRALTAMYQRVDVITQERDKARAELETERLRLEACGVVAMANTPESAARVRDILPGHFSASLHSVMGAVDREMELRAEVERLRKANEELYHGTMRQAIRLAATEADRRFFGVGELERTGYIPAGSADEREAKP